MKPRETLDNLNRAISLLSAVTSIVIGPSVYIAALIAIVVITIKNGATLYGMMFVLIVSTIPLIALVLIWAAVKFAFSISHPPTPPTTREKKLKTPVWETGRKEPDYHL